MLTHGILQRAGLNVAMGGNVGNSFAALVADGDHPYYVLELSSFQLDGIIDFRPHIAVLLNITPDHLDRYAYKMQNYVESKFRITMNQSVMDHFIHCADDPESAAWLKKTPSRRTSGLSQFSIPFLKEHFSITTRSTSKPTKPPSTCQ